ncbi:hypothetical protein FRC01_006376 [Tulasnella sp. 417]|nr:hypothetical protein FRC01_006376 [Tulasnella sp. 417]
MNDITPTNRLNEIHQSLLADLQEGSEHDPHFGVTSVTSNPSVAPLRTIQDLDQCIKIAEQSLEKAYLRLLSPLTTAKRRRNTTFSPIFKLPVEILGAIFEMTCDIEPVQNAGQRPNHVEHLHNLVAVSWQIFSVVMGTPTLWAVADWRCSLSQVKMCLEKSRGASIAVKYDWRDEQTSRNNGVPIGWLDSLLAKHAPRWRDAELFINTSGKLDMLPKVAAPRLRRIVVNTDILPFGEPIHLFGGNTPKLRVIDLTGIHVHWEWDPGMIANLRSLVLQRCQISEATARSFLSVIELSMLEEMVIRNVYFGDTVDLTTVSESFSWFYSLKKMEITRVPCEVSRHFIETIRAPHVQSATVQLLVQGGIEDWGQRVLRCLDNSILHHVEHALHIELYFSTRAGHISLFKDLGPPVVLGLQGLDLNPDAIGWLLDNIVARRKQPTLSVRLSSYDLVDQETMREILPHFLRLRDVSELELETHGYPPILEPQLLSRPVSDAGEEEWLWPRLSSVIVSGSGWARADQDVLAIVKGRLEGSSMIGDLEDAAPDEHERRSRPARIQTLNMPEIGYFSKAVMEQLEDLVPDCQLPP